MDVIGWREYVALPVLGIAQLRAKVDTGARTSALHAVDLEPFERDGNSWVRFRTPMKGMAREHRHEVRVLDSREVKNTSGLPERRLFIQTTLLLGNHRWHIEVSLANRENMGFDLILGRTAIRGRRVLVAPHRSYLVGTPTQKTRKKTQSKAVTPPAVPRGPTKGDFVEPHKQEDRT